MTTPAEQYPYNDDYSQLEPPADIGQAFLRIVTEENGSLGDPDNFETPELALAEIAEPDWPEANDKSELNDSLRLFFKESRKYKLLTAPQEVMLFKRIERGDPAAKQEMITSNLGLAISIAKNYQGQGLPLADLIQEGFIGLNTAVEKFDWRLGNKFSSYAIWCIRRAIRRALDYQSRTIRTPSHIAARERQVKQAETSLWGELKRRPTPQELAEASGLTMQQVIEVKEIPVVATSLDEPIDDESERPLRYFFADEAQASPAEEAEQALRMSVLSRALDGLSDRDRQVLQQYFGLGGQEEVSTRDIAQQLGVTQGRVHQVRVAALKNLMQNEELRAAVTDPDARDPQAEELQPLDLTLPDGRVITLEADERKILKPLSQRTNRAQIAKRAGISHPRVQAATNSICQKIGVENKIQAAPIVIEALKGLSKSKR